MKIFFGRGERTFAQIIDSLDNENSRKSMEERGRNFVAKNYGRQTIAKRIIEMSQKLIEKFKS